MTRALSAAMRGTQREEFLASRPVAAEVEAIGRAVEIAEATGAKLHIVHVSSRQRRRKGRRGASARRGRVGGNLPALSVSSPKRISSGSAWWPSVRRRCAERRSTHSSGRELLDGRSTSWRRIIRHRAPSLKKEGDFRTSWGGIAGVQSTLAVLLGARVRRPPRAVRADRDVGCGEPRSAVSNSRKGRAGGRKRRRSDAARSVAFVYAGRRATAPAA